MYGDTDSVFVYLPGRTREQAFQIGNEIAETITAMNPAPIRLKFEKVICEPLYSSHHSYCSCSGVSSMCTCCKETLCWIQV